MSTIASLPVYKLLLKQFENVKALNNVNKEKENYKIWNVNFQSKNSKPFFVPITNIWIQGTIIQISSDNFILNDSTGLAIVSGLKTSNNSSVKVGDFVMVVGYISRAGEIPLNPAWNINYKGPLRLFAKLKSLKITIIDKESICSKGVRWTNEVLEAQKAVVKVKMMVS